MQADLRFGFLRLSTIKKCPHMLKSDHRGPRNSKGKFLWVVVGGGMKWLPRQSWFNWGILIKAFIFLASIKSDLVNFKLNWSWLSLSTTICYKWESYHQNDQSSLSYSEIPLNVFSPLNSSGHLINCHWKKVTDNTIYTTSPLVSSVCYGRESCLWFWGVFRPVCRL